MRPNRSVAGERSSAPLSDSGERDREIYGPRPRERDTSNPPLCRRVAVDGAADFGFLVEVLVGVDVADVHRISLWCREALLISTRRRAISSGRRRRSRRVAPAECWAARVNGAAPVRQSLYRAETDWSKNGFCDSAPVCAS